MIRFLDGPAARETLDLRRAPILLRVAHSRHAWDALDQLDDEPKRTETLYVYILTAKPDWIHICARGKGGKALRGLWPIASYRHLAEAVEQEILHDNARWSDWCEANRDRLTPDWARAGVGSKEEGAAS